MKKKDLYIAVIVSLSYLIINMLLNSLWHYHQLHNDFWDLLFIAKNIDFRNAFSLVNPCIPIGYTTLLHFIIKTGSEITIPIIVNLIFGTVTLFVSILFYLKIMEKSYGILSAFLLGFFPLFLFYFNQGGADPGSVMFFTSGAFLLINLTYLTKTKPWSLAFISGLLFGLSALFRYHCLVGAAMFIFTLFLFNIRKWNLFAVSTCGVVIAYLPQIFINLVTGHGALETKLGASNIYDLMYGINWYKTSTEHISTNAIEIISTDYFLFVKRYLISFVKFFIQTGMIPLSAAIIVKKTLHKKIAWIITAFVFLYFALFSATLSGRQVLLPLPLTMLCFGILVKELFNFSDKQSQIRQKVMQAVIVLAVSTVSLFFIVKNYHSVIRNVKEATFSKSVESYLVEMGCTDSRQIYTTDYDIYFKTLPNYTGYFNGGWSRWGTYKYNEAFPEFDVKSIDDFIEDCKDKNIRFVILTKNSYKLIKELGEIYDLTLLRKELLFKKEAGRVRIFQVR